MRRLGHLALRAVGHVASKALATRIDPVMVAPEPESLTPAATWDEAMDGPAPFWPHTWNLTPEEQADYHALACEHVEHAADLRAAQHEADFALWRMEYMTRGEVR